MTFKQVALAVVFLLMGGTAFAQEYDKWEVPVDYSYMRFNPAQGKVSSTAGNWNMNGGGGGVVYNFTQYLGIRADLQGFNSGTHNFVVPVVTPPIAGAPPAGTYSASGNLFTYQFGPQIRIRTPRFQPFFEVLLGGAHSNLYGNLAKAEGVVSNNNPSYNAFAMLAGGGVDVRLNQTFTIRLGEFDYQLTRFSNSTPGLSGTWNQNSFRYSAGLVFTFDQTH